MHITAIEKRPQVALDADKTDSAKTYIFQLQVVNRSTLHTFNSKKFLQQKKAGKPSLVARCRKDWFKNVLLHRSNRFTGLR